MKSPQQSWREYYERKKNDPEFMARRRKSVKDCIDKIRHTPEFKAKEKQRHLEYSVKVRDSKEFRKKRSDHLAKYRANPETYPIVLRTNEKWIRHNPEKNKAHNVVHAAIKAGKLIRPSSCARCGDCPPPARDGRSQLHAHHEDHSKPLDVEWLCAFCHGNERRKH